MTIHLIGIASMLIVMMPALVGAQSTGTIGGQVRDTSRAVMPGVSVEAASPALIEKVRSVVTDGAGEYKIINLSPGVYTVTFTLPGFTTVRREGVELTTGFTANVDVELQVGALEETVTVSGLAPVVDVQNVQQQRVMTREIVDLIPTGRRFSGLATLIPGMLQWGVQTNGPDVGGASGSGYDEMSIHGGKGTDQQQNYDGMPVGLYEANGSGGMFNPPNTTLEETNIQTAAQAATTETGGVRINWVPKSGGNTYNGAIFADLGHHSLQSDNVDASLKVQGATAATGIDYVYEFNPSLGGPIARDKLWFYAGGRKMRSRAFTTIYPNLTKDGWAYTPDYSKGPLPDDQNSWDVANRFTWQVSPRNKLNLNFNLERFCSCQHFLGRIGIVTQEASLVLNVPFQLWQGAWSSPVTNKFLIDAAAMVNYASWGAHAQPDAIGPPALDAGTGYNFRSRTGGPGPTTGNFKMDYHTYMGRASVSYVTGSHNLNVGGSLISHVGIDNHFGVAHGDFFYNVTLLNGRPSAVTYLTDPYRMKNRALKVALYAQDQWTIKRLTANLGLRFDSITESYPDVHLVATPLGLPARDFPAGDVVDWKDLSPRLGIAYDLLGNGKTALKASVSRFVGAEVLALARGNGNPAIAANPTLTRSWNDVNGDFIPQGDPINPAANGELGPSTNSNFGRQVFSTRLDPSYTLGGFGSRLYNWEFSAGLQHEIVPRVSVSAEYFRRIWGNFQVLHNDARTSADFNPYCITAPVDARLPGGGGQQICGLYDVVPSKVGAIANVITLAKNYGKQYEHFNGMDFTVNARLTGKFLLQGGFSFGKPTTDNCDVVENHLELLGAGVPLSYCRPDKPVMSQAKLLGSYMLPWDIQIAATYQNTPGVGMPASGTGQVPGVGANYVVPNALVAPSLGRNLSTGPTSTVTVNLIPLGTRYHDRINQLDLRGSRSFDLGTMEVKLNVDFYNLLNYNGVLRWNDTYGTTGSTWLRPFQIAQGRMVKFGALLNF